MHRTLVAISLGASLGAILRWQVGNWLNPVCALFPVGTLAVNVAGSLVFGLATGVFEAMPQLAPEWRLAIVTGFLGALTTFSTFAAEMGTLIVQHKFVTALVGMLLHVGGSVAAFLLGLWLWHLLASHWTA